MILTIHTRRLRVTNLCSRPWRAWAEGFPFSADGPTEKAALLDLLALLMDYLGDADPSAPPEDLDELLLAEQLEPASSEGGGL